MTESDCCLQSLMHKSHYALSAIRDVVSSIKYHIKNHIQS
ncbi:hypothetical protein HMPREF1548_00955 [Clostridium sp. KLE 1755]|nr:hypothetical protein HMPREF1548_00955 [Clostridium sp. KLE 1755]